MKVMTSRTISYLLSAVFALLIARGITFGHCYPQANCTPFNVAYLCTTPCNIDTVNCGFACGGYIHCLSAVVTQNWISVCSSVPGYSMGCNGQDEMFYVDIKEQGWRLCYMDNLFICAFNYCPCVSRMSSGCGGYICTGPCTP